MIEAFWISSSCTRWSIVERWRRKPHCALERRLGSPGSRRVNG